MSPFQGFTSFRRLWGYTSTDTSEPSNVWKSTFPITWHHQEKNYTWVTGSNVGFEAFYSSLSLKLDPHIINSHWPTQIPQGPSYCSLYTPSPRIRVGPPPPNNSDWFCFQQQSLEPKYDQANAALCRTLSEVATFLGFPFCFFLCLQSFSWGNFLNKSLAHDPSR